ncbi:MAG TPA: F0F1 ATP synthase subunit A, partial [Lacipirellulaceae bacterium]|nr:F0F1 ATP synthase subunit A [Lacipirellulaceae bacterium]
IQGMPDESELLEQYHHWRHDHAHYASPFDRFLEEAPSQAWLQRPLALGRYENRAKDETNAGYSARLQKAGALRDAWANIKAQAENLTAYQEHAGEWPAEKIESYNRMLDGKILIPQQFGKLRNNYEKESGFAISKFMILELVVALVLVLVFRALAGRMKDGRVPKGRLWNMFEAFLNFIRNDIAEPAIGHHDAHRFVPLLWTIFMFVLGLNLLGMLPWLGAPTASFSVTLALAAVTFATVIVAGSLRFGVVGFWKNQVPSMGLPLPLAIPIVPMLFAIEVLGLFIKHGVLGVRLLANMVAGHLVLLAVMGLGVAAAGSGTWPITATIAVVGSALFSLLELFVAFLQAYVFTFLSALFIGAAVHHH